MARQCDPGKFPRLKSAKRFGEEETETEEVKENRKNRGTEVKSFQEVCDQLKTSSVALFTSEPPFNKSLLYLPDLPALFSEPLYTPRPHIVQLHNNVEKAGIRCGVVEIKVSGWSDVYALNVFNTVDKGNVMVDCSGDPYEVGPESIVHMNSQELHHMVFTPIEDAPASFLADMGNMSEIYALDTCEANIKSYTW